jgi:hypothetical protein
MSLKEHGCVIAGDSMGTLRKWRGANDWTNLDGSSYNEDGPIYLEPSHSAPITALKLFGSSGGFISAASDCLKTWIVVSPDSINQLQTFDFIRYISI